MTKLKLLSICAIVLLFSINFSEAKQVKSSKTGGKWSEKSSWIGGEIPALGDTVEISSTIIADYPVHVSFAKVLESGTLEIQSPNSIIDKEFFNYGNLKVDLKANISFDCLVNNGNIENFGEIYVQNPEDCDKYKEIKN